MNRKFVDKSKSRSPHHYGRSKIYRTDDICQYRSLNNFTDSQLTIVGKNESFINSVLFDSYIIKRKYIFFCVFEIDKLKNY